jgi:hypothetical protein
MADPQYGLTLEVEIYLLSTDEGGRKGPIHSGVRPLCLIPSEPGSEPILVGMCEVELVGRTELNPGESGDAMLKFATGADDIVRSQLPLTGEIVLMDGPRYVMGRATMKAG